MGCKVYGWRWTCDNKKQTIHCQWARGVAATPRGGWNLPELGGRSSELRGFNPPRQFEHWIYIWLFRALQAVRLWIVFSGRRFWEFEGQELVSDCPPSGRALTDLGFDELVPRIDAAAVGLGSLNRRVYLFSGYEYWRLRQDGPGRMTVDRYYPQEISMVFRGVPPNIDAAFTNVDGKQLVCRRLAACCTKIKHRLTAVKTLFRNIWLLQC